MVWACKKEDSENIDDNSNLAILVSDSISLTSVSSGFSFAKRSVIEYPNKDQIIPDFKVYLAMRTISHEDTSYSAILTSLVDKPTFIFVDSLSTYEGANQLFNEYIPASYNYTMIRTQPFIDENQIWMVKSLENEYYLIQITEFTLSANPNFVGKRNQKSKLCSVKFRWKTL